MINRSIPHDALILTRSQIEEYHWFHNLVMQMIEVNELPCHVQLRDATLVKNFDKRFAYVVGTEIASEIERSTVNDLDFERIETSVRRHTLTVATRLVEQRLNVDHSDCHGATMLDSCGKPTH